MVELGFLTLAIASLVISAQFPAMEFRLETFAIEPARMSHEERIYSTVSFSSPLGT